MGILSAEKFTGIILTCANSRNYIRKNLNINWDLPELYAANDIK